MTPASGVVAKPLTPTMLCPSSRSRVDDVPRMVWAGLYRIEGRTPPILIAVGETVWVLKVLASWGIWLKISSVVTAPLALMAPASTVIRFVPTGAIPLIEVPVAVTVTASTSGWAGWAPAGPAITVARAPTEAPHRSFLTTRVSNPVLKNIGSFPSCRYFRSAPEDARDLICAQNAGTPKPCQASVEHGSRILRLRRKPEIEGFQAVADLAISQCIQPVVPEKAVKTTIRMGYATCR